MDTLRGIFTGPVGAIDKEQHQPLEPCGEDPEIDLQATQQAFMTMAEEQQNPARSTLLRASDVVKDGASNVYEKAGEMKDYVMNTETAHKLGEMKDDVKQRAFEAKDAVKEKAYEAKEDVKDRYNKW